jgi:hypothetical protein
MRYRSLNIAAVLFLASCVGVGIAPGEDCSPREAPQTEAAPNETPMAAPAGARELPSDEDCESLAIAFQSAIAAGDTEGANRLFDWHGLAEASVVDVDMPVKKKNDFIKGVKEGSRERLMEQLCGLTAAGGSLRYLRTRTLDGHKTMLFRQILADGSLNYLEFMVHEKHGELKLFDFYVHMSGERCSATVRRMALLMLANDKKSFLERALQLPSQAARDAGGMNRALELLAEGKGQEAYDTIERLSLDMQKEKATHLLKIRASQQLGDATYEKALDAYQQRFPNDPSLDLIRIDRHILAKEYDAAVGCLDRLGISLGGDPYLDTLKAGIYRLQGSFAEARNWAERGAAALPELLPPQLELLAIDHQEKKYADVLAGVDRAEAGFGLNAVAYLADDFFAPLRESPEYQAWLEKRPAPAEPAEPVESGESVEP